MNKLLIYIIEFIHVSYIFLPLIIVLFPIKYIKQYFKYIFLISILTPISWGLNNNRCILSDAVIKLDNETTENVSRKKLKWLYKPIVELLGMDWNSNKDLDFVVYLHWGLNFIVLWTYLFYIAKCKIV
tara:strand:- start:2074 stop:2457 length:384 start_codon:yes stop_codon:yes gene_type:complete